MFRDREQVGHGGCPAGWAGSTELPSAMSLSILILEWKGSGSGMFMRLALMIHGDGSLAWDGRRAC